MAKTTIKLKYAGSIWPVVENWADENDYALETPGESSRLYLRRSKETSVQIFVAFSQAGDQVQIKSWFSDLIRKELEINSPSLYAALPRKEAFSEIQKLLAALGAVSPRKPKTTGKKNLAFNLGRSIRKISGKK